MVQVNIRIVFDLASSLYINVEVCGKAKRILTMPHTILYGVVPDTSAKPPTQPNLSFYDYNMQKSKALLQSIMVSFKSIISTRQLRKPSC